MSRCSLEHPETVDQPSVRDVIDQQRHSVVDVLDFECVEVDVSALPIPVAVELYMAAGSRALSSLRAQRQLRNSRGWKCLVVGQGPHGHSR